jgi:TolB-like protein
MSNLPKFLREIWKRRVAQFGALYLGVAWIVLQVAVTLEDTLELPNWIDQSVLVLLVAGLPLALILAWAQETRSGGLPDSGIDGESTNGDPTIVDALPAIFVPPLRNLSGGEEETIIADGLTDEITVLLTRIRGLKVAHRQAVRNDTAEEPDPFAFANSLGARFALTGNVRRVDETLRISCELTDIRDNQQVWSEHYDRSVTDLLALQDEIAIAVVGSIHIIIMLCDGQRAAQKPIETLAPWDLVCLAATGVNLDFRQEKIDASIDLNSKALDLDPDYALAHGWIGHGYGHRVLNGWTKDKGADMRAARHHAERAYTLASEDAQTVWLAAEAYWTIGDYTDAIALLERSVTRAPDILDLWPFSICRYGTVLAQGGRGEEGVEVIEKFIANWPNHPLVRWQRVQLGFAELAQGQYARVVESLAEPINEYTALCRIIALVKLGQMEHARDEYCKITNTHQDYPLDYFIELFKVYHVDRSIGAELSGALVELKEALAPKIAPTTKPAIAVLPFVNMSDDKEKEYFADGLTEDLITGLSQSKHLSVTARTSTFAYKGKSPNIRKVGEELDVKYVVEGSVRPMGERLRINVQLIEAATGAHLWAEKYDQPTDQLFEMQDEMLRKISSALDAQLTTAEIERISKLKAQDLNSWEAVQRAQGIYAGTFITKKNIDEGIDLLTEARNKNPDYVYAEAALAHLYFTRLSNFYSENISSDHKSGSELVDGALMKLGDDGFALGMAGQALFFAGRFDEAKTLLERAMATQPGSTTFHSPYGILLAQMGDLEGGHRAFDEARALTPSGGYSINFNWFDAMIYAMEDNFEKAQPVLEEVARIQPGFSTVHIYRAYCFAKQGQEQPAREALKQAIKAAPMLTPAYLSLIPIHPDREEHMRRVELLTALWPDNDGDDDGAQ